MKRYPKYPLKGVALYSVYRDLCMNNECEVKSIVDTGVEYVIEATVKKTSKSRLHLPIGIDDDVELVRLHKYACDCEQSGMELCLCMYSQDSIIYQLVNTTLKIQADFKAGGTVSL